MNKDVKSGSGQRCLHIVQEHFDRRNMLGLRVWWILGETVLGVPFHQVSFSDVFFPLGIWAQSVEGTRDICPKEVVSFAFPFHTCPSSRTRMEAKQPCSEARPPCWGGEQTKSKQKGKTNQLKPTKPTLNKQQTYLVSDRARRAPASMISKRCALLDTSM